MVSPAKAKRPNEALAASLDILLRQHVTAYFARDQYIKPALYKMQGGGIYTIGDLLSKPAEETFKNFRVGPSNQRKLIGLVETFGLKFSTSKPS